MFQFTQGHSYGPGCNLARHSDLSKLTNGEMPVLRAQFFYASQIGIDDPLSATPIPSSKSRATDHPPRPFSAYDNAALEQAWTGFSASARRGSKKGQGKQKASSQPSISTFSDLQPEQAGSKSRLSESAPESPFKDINNGGPKPGVLSYFKRAISFENVKARSDLVTRDGESSLHSTEKLGGLSYANDDQIKGDWSPPPNMRRHEAKGKGISKQMGTGVKASEIVPTSSNASYPSNRGRSVKAVSHGAPGDVLNKFMGDDYVQELNQHTAAENSIENEDKENKPEKRSRSWSRNRRSSPSRSQDPNQTVTDNLPAPNADATITGRPFLRLPSRRASHDPSLPSNTPNQDIASKEEDHEQDRSPLPGCKARQDNTEQIDIPVGISRLHHVQLPSLQMKPIYWNPVHDIAAVTRGTWFYKDTCFPVEPLVANQLELGYRELKPWSETWGDELKSAIDVGAEAEEKIAHQLWSKEDERKSKPNKRLEHTLSADPYCAASCFNGEASAEGTVDLEEPTDSKQSPTAKTSTKRYPNSQVIYKDDRNAYILKPTLQPSAYYGRKPLSKIKKGQTVGIHVVRGFDWKSWEKLHPSKKTSNAIKAEEMAPVAVGAGGSKLDDCRACKHEEKRPKVTDVVLVIHGIGQKLSERVESFNFTHAINGFRRSVNLEMAHRDVQKVLREDLGGIMALPINWRANLSFEDGGPMKEEDKNQPAADHFTLDDITPTTIPAVRNIISDVMLDIPYYMSPNHKPKILRAVVSEANRVYRLWCQNNPAFATEGRVHIIAHSLGSAMALDVLSKQPTSVPPFNPDDKEVNYKFFDFNTTNLFLAGSPAGFFLYLEKAMLLPRRGQHKAGIELGDDKDNALVGDAGTFGCLAVDNIYNIMHYNDPIAYRMNAAVDPQYAASLKSAQVPTATIGFFERVLARKASTDSSAAKPPGMARLPSQLEMAVHNFSREEIAERKLNLLNDNGQIDWFLSSGGGPLEIQYINMLGAHSSYWESQDFIRFIVVEVGRKAGKVHTLPYMRAMKVGTLKSIQKSSS